MRTKRTKSDENNLVIPEDPHTLCKRACIRDVQPSKNGPSSFWHTRQSCKNKILNKGHNKTKESDIGQKQTR